MARPGSIAVAGFYATPQHLMERIAAIFSRKTRGEDDGSVAITFVDPCAGEGEAVLKLIDLLCHSGDEKMSGSDEVKLYTCEMESTRHATLVANVGRSSYIWKNNALQGDAFRVTFSHGKSGGANILYLNPPYDTDPIHGRLEQRFLERFTGVLGTGGALVFVVPYYALTASAEFIGREFEEVRCFRFPEADWDAYKQIVLVAKKRDPLFDADPAIVAVVQEWATDPDSIQELPQVGDPPLVQIPVSPRYEGGLDDWQIRQVDVNALLGKVQPWMQSTRAGAAVPVPGVIPDLPVQDLLLRRYPMATPPRPAHIAAGIASGLFNGARIEPDTSRLPPLLVKGVFDREYRTIEQKVNADGQVKGLVQIQQPKLVTTVLDLRTHKYHQLKTGTDETGSLDVANMGVADLLKHYGASLMTVMETQCPILYDPRRDAGSVTLPDSPRKMFTAQAHASRALVKLLGGQNISYRDRRGKAAILLGEIGSGKSTVSVMAARAIKSRRLLIMCPPHLLRSWENELAAVWPEADARVLRTVTDVESIATASGPRPIVAILSREVAKLSHAWEGAGAVCPACGHVTPDVDLAKTRARCEARDLIPSDDLAKEAIRYATWLAAYAPQSPTIRDLLRSRFGKLRLDKLAEKQTQAKLAGKPWVFSGTPPEKLDRALDLLIQAYEGASNQEDIQRAITLCLLTTGDEDRIVATVRRFAGSTDYRTSEFARALVLLLPPGSEKQRAIIEEMQKASDASYGYNPWASISAAIEHAKNGVDYSRVGTLKISWKDGVLAVDGKAPQSTDAATAALGAIRKCSRFTWGKTCGEFLFQAIASPRRVSLARHIVNRYPSLFDFLILDEGHEYATEGSAQEKSAHRLTSLGIPTVLMTGTIMNGYAESLFMNMWALSSDFRKEFGREDKQRFIDRYGYRKRLLEDKDKEGNVVEFGSNSDRETHSERIIGNAPGLLPLFLLRHLLPISVTLHKADLAIDLPPNKMERHLIAPDAAVKKRYERLQAALVKQIKKDLFDPELSGRLWGQLAEIPSYLDRATADVGNNDSGSYAIHYPESVGGKLVAAEEGLDASTLLPKEEWMLDLLEKELAEGRNVMVFAWHVKLLPRFARIISERIGEPVPVLYADKVGTAKRQDWIDKEVIKKKRRVLVTNPVAIQTGLNNLVHFATELWLENPACNPVIYRQAIGRVDRIGQKRDTRIHFPVYDGTLQVQLYDLLAKKVAVSVSTDGLDPESALQAAGVGEDEYLAGLSIGKQLWAMLNGPG